MSARIAGDDVALLEGKPSPAALFWMDMPLEGFGTRVIFGDDFRKPACSESANTIMYTVSDAHRTQTAQPLSSLFPQNSFGVRHYPHSKFDERSSRRGHFGGLVFYIS